MSILKLNTKVLKGSFEDADYGETITKLNELMLNSQALMSVVAKINSLSLINYLK
jgi:flagellin-like hook-associated protein FlgL